MKMNGLFIVSLVCLFSYYLVSLTHLSAIAFILFGLTIVSMVGAIYKEFDQKNEKDYLKVLK
jgi:hypothetical protein